MITALLILASYLPVHQQPDVAVDRMEINTIVDEADQEKITQIIFWNWRRWLSKPQFVCEGWRTYDASRLRHVDGQWLWYTQSGEVVVSRTLVFTRTRHDPEKDNRENYPPERRALRRGP